MPEPVTEPIAADVLVPREAVEESVGGCYWSVSCCGWAPGALPEEYAALLAPPIVVGVVAAPALAG